MSLSYKYVLSVPDNPNGAAPLTLPVNPEDYDKIDYAFKRSETQGIFHEIITDLKFVREGRDYLINAFDTNGIHAQVICTIYKRNKDTDEDEFFYQGKVQFADATQTRDYFICDLEAEGFQQTFLNSTEKSYDILTYTDSSGNTQSTLRDTNYQPKVIQKQYEGENDQAVYDEVNNSALLKSNYDELFFPLNTPTTLINELEAFSYPLFLKETSLIDDLQFLIEAKEEGSYTINVDVECQFYMADNSGPGLITSVDYNLIKVSGSVYTTLDTVNIPFVDQRNIPLTAVLANYFQVTGGALNATETLLPGEQIYIQGHAQYSATVLIPLAHYIRNNNVIGIEVIKSKAQVIGNTEFATTTVPSVPIYEALLSVAQKITGQTDVLRSDYYGRTDSPDTYLSDGAGSLGVFIDGNRLRGILDKSLSISWEKLIDCLKLIDNIGWGIEQEGFRQVIRVEPIEYFYQDSESINLLDSFNVGRQKKLLFFEDIEKKPNEDLYFSSIKFSYPKLESQDINGIDEFNTSREFVTPVQEIENIYNLRSEIRTSGYEIELQRRKSLEPTTDTKIDDDFFLTAVVRDGFTFSNETDETFTTTGVIGPDNAYNVRYAPTRSLFRHGNWISSSLLGLSDNVTFATGELNYLMTSQEGGQPVIAENGDFSNSDLALPILVPEIYMLEIPLSNADVQTIKSNPYNYITLTVKKDNVIKPLKMHILNMELVEASEYKDVFGFELVRRFEIG